MSNQPETRTFPPNKLLTPQLKTITKVLIEIPHEMAI